MWQRSFYQALVGGPDPQAHVTRGAIVWVYLVACLPVTIYCQSIEMGSGLISDSQTGVPLELVGDLFNTSCTTG